MPILCYNGANKKPRPWGEVAAKPTERAKPREKNPLTRLRRELSQRESLYTLSYIFGGMDFSRCLCNIKAKLAKKR